MFQDLTKMLLDKKGKMPKHTTDIVNRLVSHGMLFTIATSRSIDCAVPIISGLYLRLPIIVCNGAFIAETKKGYRSEILAFFVQNRKKYCLMHSGRQVYILWFIRLLAAGTVFYG